MSNRKSSSYWIDKFSRFGIHIQEGILLLMEVMWIFYISGQVYLFLDVCLVWGVFDFSLIFVPFCFLCIFGCLLARDCLGFFCFFFVFFFFTLPVGFCDEAEAIGMAVTASFDACKMHSFRVLHFKMPHLKCRLNDFNRLLPLHPDLPLCVLSLSDQLSVLLGLLSIVEEHSAITRRQFLWNFILKMKVVRFFKIIQIFLLPTQVRF